MKILLDECLPHDFRHSIPGYEIHTVQWAGLRGKKNGELLLAAQTAGYEVLITVDQGIPHQQRTGALHLAILVIRSRTNQIEDLLPLTSAIIQALEAIHPGQIIVIPPPEGCS